MTEHQHDVDAPTPREAIAALVHRYSDAVVRRDAEQWANCWAEDAHWFLGPGRSVTGRTAIAELWLKAIGNFSAVVQTVNNGAVDVTGGTATGRWHINERYRRMNGDVGMLLAYYDDTYVRVGDSWLFASRTLVPQYQGPPDLSAPFLNDISREA